MTSRKYLTVGLLVAAIAGKYVINYDDYYELCHGDIFQLFN